jgi:hypothetical protein
METVSVLVCRGLRRTNQRLLGACAELTRGEFEAQAEHRVPALQKRVSAIERPLSYLGMPNMSLSVA